MTWMSLVDTILCVCVKNCYMILLYAVSYSCRNEAKFALLEKSPSVLNLKAMEEKLDNIQIKRTSQ